MAAQDKRKLDEFLNGVREVEQRIERSTDDNAANVELDYPRPPNTPRDYGEHLATDVRHDGAGVSDRPHPYRQLYVC